MEEALPECLKSKCAYCNGQSEEDGDKACSKYYYQMQFTFYIAANEFVSLILNHPHIYNNKKILLNVTQEFYRSFRLVKGKGVMYFDLENICRCILKAGFESLSLIFQKSQALQNLKIINDSIDDIEQRKLDNEIFNKEDEDYLDLQQKFFENKQRYYKEKLLLEEKGLLPERSTSKKVFIKGEKHPYNSIVLLLFTGGRVLSLF